MFAKILSWFFSSSESRLVGACFGDRGKAARLISYEINRAPKISRREAVKRALERLEWDRQ